MKHIISKGLALLSFLIVGIIVMSCSSSSDNDEVGTTTTPKPTTSTKITPDAGNDLYGTLTDDSGKPVEGVTVSDGFSCVQTDSRGFYQMKRNSAATYVFYSTPADCKAKPLQFYQKLTSAQEYNFEVSRLNEIENHFMLIVLADPQVTNNTQLARLKDETMADLSETEKSTSLSTCGIVVGDLVNDKPDMMSSMRAVLSSAKTPFFTATGNHDKVPQTDTSLPRTTDNYERNFGPLYYSFNRGQVHFICLDNVVFSNADDYTAGLDDRQIAWMKADLASVPKSKMVIVYYHIPMRDSNTPGREAMLTLLKDYSNVTLMCGHTHYQQNYQVQSPIQVEERIHGTACGAWWHSVICTDGTPNGYGVYEIQGNHFVNQYYKSTRFDKSFQIRLFRGDAKFGGSYGMYNYGMTSDYVVANVFNYNPLWHVSVYEDGVYSGDMQLSQSFFKMDAWAVGLHLGVQNRSSTYAVNTSHDLIYKLKNPSAKVKVEAVDQFGNTYTQDQFTTDLNQAENYE